MTHRGWFPDRDTQADYRGRRQSGGDLTLSCKCWGLNTKHPWRVPVLDAPPQLMGLDAPPWLMGLESHAQRMVLVSSCAGCPSPADGARCFSWADSAVFGDSGNSSS